MSIKIIDKINKEDFKEFLYNIDINDKNLYNELNNPNMTGVFQFTGKTARRLTNEIQPKNFDEMNAVNAMSRPGPIENVPIYKQRKEGEPSPYPEAINKILEDTHFTCIFQEQVMEIFHKIGGFSLEEADEVRNLMKKLGKAEKNPDDLKMWGKAVKKFTRGALKNNIDEETAKNITNDLFSFSSYSFNKAHSTAYTYIAIMTLYLSVYFRKYFYSAFLNDKDDKELLEILSNVKAQGFEIFPPDINRSKLYFYPGKKNQILFGLNKIKRISDNSGKFIIENRPYKSLINFIIKTRSQGRTITSAVIKALVSVGAFDNFNKNRKKLLLIFNKFWESKKSIKIEEKLIALYEQKEKEINEIPGIETTIGDKITYEKEYFGYNFFTTLFIKSKIKIFTKMAKRNLINLGFQNVDEISRKTPIVINNIRKFKDKNENEMVFIEIEDMFGSKEKIPIFHSYYQFISDRLISEKMFLMALYKSDDGKIMFGKSGWVTNEFAIGRMIRKV